MMADIIWNKAKDMMPPIGKTVLTYADKKIGMGAVKYYSNRSCMSEIPTPPQKATWTSNNEIFNPTHWAVIPLPEIIF